MFHPSSWEIGCIFSAGGRILSGHFFSLAIADVRDDLSRFHLLHYGGKVDGFLISAHNSGTHWVRFMLSAAIAHHLGLPPPLRSSGRESDIFIGNARHMPRHASAPRIGSSHHLPSRLIGILGRIGLVRLPPIVLLVRGIPDALCSYFLKWRDAKSLGSLPDYLFSKPRRKAVNLWWYIRFFNRWGSLLEALPSSILVARYEDIIQSPCEWVRRIWWHWGVELSEASLAAAGQVASRSAVAAHLDPTYGEAVVPELAARRALCLKVAEARFLEDQLGRHLRCTFGYRGGATASAGPRIPTAHCSLFSSQGDEPRDFAP